MDKTNSPMLSVFYHFFQILARETKKTHKKRVATKMSDINAEEPLLVVKERLPHNILACFYLRLFS